MGRKGKDGAPQDRRKAPAGQGRVARREREFRKRSAKAIQAQLGHLQTERKRTLQKAGQDDESAKSTGFEKAYVPNAAPTERRPVKRFFWQGPPPEGEPDEPLKLKRKNLGIKVRGVPIPEPVESFLDSRLPSEFARFFKGPRGSKMKKPTAIQMQVWPAALCGIDVLGIAPTGSGKTLGYLLPAVPHVLGQPERAKGSVSPICLVLLPTRELAAQVCDQCRGSGGLRHLFNVRAEAIYGGVGKDVQLDSILSLGAPQVMAATPGRLLDLLGLQALSLDDVSYLVLDEADRMLALGFEPQLDALAKGIRPDRQTLLFSATFPLKLRQAADRWMSKNQVVIRVGTMEVGAADGDEPHKGKNQGSASSAAPAKAQVLAELPLAKLKELSAKHSVSLQGCLEKADIVAALQAAGVAAQEPEGGEGGEDARHESAASGGSTLSVSPNITQILHVCSEHKKQRKLVRFMDKIREDEKQQGVRQRALFLVFCNTIATLKQVANFLGKHHHRCAPLHSGIPQLKREKALSEFKAGQLLVLVATDVAARGLHIKHLRYVINYDFPSNLEQYCHRIGRTGRDGESGTAYSFFTRNMAPLAKDLVSLLERSGAAVDPNLRELAEWQGKGPKAESEDDGDSDDAEVPGFASAAVSAPETQAGQPGSKASSDPPAARKRKGKHRAPSAGAAAGDSQPAKRPRSADEATKQAAAAGPAGPSGGPQKQKHKAKRPKRGGVRVGDDGS